MVLPTDPAPGIRTGYRNGAGHTDRCSTRCMRTAHGSCDRPDFGPPVTTGSHTDSDRSTGPITCWNAGKEVSKDTVGDLTPIAPAMPLPAPHAPPHRTVNGRFNFRHGGLTPSQGKPQN